MNNLLTKLLAKAGKALLCASGISRDTAVTGSISVGNKTIKNLVALGGYHRPGVTKAGQLSFAGICEGHKVKVYSSFTRQQTALRVDQRIAGLPGCSFNEVIVAEDQLVVEKWIEGTPLSKLGGTQLAREAEKVEEFLTALAESTTSVQLAAEYPSAFCYFEHYLLARLAVWSNHDKVKTLLQEWQSDYSKIVDAVPARLGHADLSMDNIIRENDTGRLLVIDNELLGAGRGWILDWKNSLLGKSGKKAPAYLDAVPKQFIDKTWTLRRLGSALDSGDLATINTILGSRQ